MARFSIFLTLAIAALVSGPVASADVGDWYVAPLVIYNDDDPYRAIEDSVSGLQINVGRNMSEHLTLEGLLSYSDIPAEPCDPLDCFPGQRNLDLGLNLLAYHNRESRIAPYLHLGVGYLTVNPDPGTAFNRDSGDSAVTASAGIGFKWRLGDSNSAWSIRGDYRARAAFDDETLLDQILGIGVQYRFGSRRADPGVPETDTDGDGVLDMWDECPNTPAGVEVTSRGCELMNIERDEDGDHVYDSIDQCPGTPAGAPVDKNGCSLDSDMDGVTTDKDRCPGTPAGVEVNAYGCDNDRDRDGVANHLDRCPDSRAGARVDVTGCEVRDVISLPGVNFEPGMDILLPGTEVVLKQAANILNKHPELQIEVIGHTDDVGDDISNLGLSERRAKTVRNFLVKFGVAEERLTVKGYGESRPISDNTTPHGRASNRRVELRLVEDE